MEPVRLLLDVNAPMRVATVADADGDTVTVEVSAIDRGIWVSIDEGGDSTSVLLDAEQARVLITALAAACDLSQGPQE